MLLQLQLNEARGHPGGVDRGVDGAEDIGQGADVVLMSVGDKDAPNLLLVLNEIADIRDDYVDAVHIVVGKAHAAVHHHDVAAVLVNREVLADLVEAAKRNDFQFFSHKYSLSSF